MPKKLKMVEDPRKRLRYWSFRIQTLIGVALMVFLALPDDKKAELLAILHVSPAYALLVGVGATIFSQFIKQTKLEEAEEERDAGDTEQPPDTPAT